MTKTVWIYSNVEYDSYEKAKKAFYEDIHKTVRNREYEFSEWFNDEYEGCDFDHYNYWSAWEIAEAMGVDFDDYEDDYAESIFDDAIEEVEKPCGYVFDLDDGETVIYETEDEARARAEKYANETFLSWLDKSRGTNILLSAVLANALGDELWLKIFNAYKTQCILHVRTATEEEVEDSEGIEV